MNGILSLLRLPADCLTLNRGGYRALGKNRQKYGEDGRSGRCQKPMNTLQKSASIQGNSVRDCKRRISGRQLVPHIAILNYAWLRNHVILKPKSEC